MSGVGENRVARELLTLGIKIERQKEFRRDRRWVQVDFYLPEVRGVIEVEYSSFSTEERLRFLRSFDVDVVQIRVTNRTCYFCETIRALVVFKFKGLWPECPDCSESLEHSRTNSSTNQVS